jgi:hypothetical protein
VQDTIGHVFWKAHHLATVHHHHGNHHAEEEIAEVAHEEENDKSPTTTKTFEPLSVHIVLQTPYNIPHLTTEKQKFKITVFNYSTVSLDKHYPPPRSC